MSQPSQFQNNFLQSMTNILNSLSFYSPIIVCVSIFAFSMFTVTQEKAFIFFALILLATFLRMFPIEKNPQNDIPPICLTGITQIFIHKDVTYSIFILTFTMAYFITPMILVSAQNKINMMNYSILSFFIFYIVLDIYVKTSLNCITNGSSLVLGNIVGGLFLGIVSAGGMYGTRGKPYLYINEINSNKEVCSMPSKQQFKCNVYRNGELVGNV